MYLIIPPQPDCVSTWREAVRGVDAEPRHEAHNVLMTVQNPASLSSSQDPRLKVIDDFLRTHDKSVQTVANTIFPQGLYHRYGAPDFFDRFSNNVLPTVRRSERWSGYYFERMIDWPGAPYGNPLWDIVTRMRDPKIRARNKFELALFDPARDLDRSPYGGQCLSFLSFKLLPGTPNTVCLTAFYRNHYYVEKLLGNLIGLESLLTFVAKETGLEVGPLTIISSHAQIDLPKSCQAGTASRAQLMTLLETIDKL